VILVLAGETRVVRGKNWSELPEVLKPKVYYVDGEKFVVYKPVGK
jgi:hypothetical protein